MVSKIKVQASMSVKIGLTACKTLEVIPYCITHYRRGTMDDKAQISKINHEQVFTSPASFTHQSKVMYHVFFSMYIEKRLHHSNLWVHLVAAWL